MSRVLALLATGLAAVSIAAAVITPDILPDFAGADPVQTTQKRAPAVAAKIPALRPVDTDAEVSEILGRSPFDQQRRPFSREAPVAPPPPPPPPRLLGISTSNGKHVATVEWPSTGAIQRLVVGDTTDLGKVASIERTRIVLKGKDAEVVVSMY